MNLRANLYVRRDNTTSGRGRWRLYWSTPESDTCAVVESEVTGQPYFRTMRAAIEHGLQRYGERAERAKGAA